MNSKLLNKLDQNSPKRILSIDGGGIRGTLTLGMLKKIEKIAREKTSDSNLVLGQYYDLIGGTSTGAIIASGLATGKTIDEIIQLYLNLGVEIFGKGRKNKFLNRDWTTLRAIFNENYSSENFEKYLQRVFGETTINDQENILCGLAINTKRADTYSLWTVTNHPRGKYYEANAPLKLWELCRASSAAPYYFKPKLLSVKRRSGENVEGTWIDGGVSLANNPAWQNFLVVSEPSFGFSWKSGKDNISITSLGTGNGLLKDDPRELEQMKAVGWASKLSDLFMIDALEMNLIIMEVFGHNVGSRYAVDSQFGEVGNLNLIGPENKLFTFERHNVFLTKNALSDLGISLEDEQLASLSEMDHYENMETLLKIGEQYAEKHIHSIL